ncbi:ATP-binding cassette domain-containing protein (plasmid) [Halorussus limi]|uniref:ATP-binding cassette domain-containing protein n=1 Tax=Halorussus limi TaxID=2938695 RepID=A0A8U0I1L7_9EURY|nr:ATP-binding cassette domain-containing protein [Halorussus limi]UPV76614.1 ATP-binding cassette domain-containing protein [Halorussus limi]
MAETHSEATAVLLELSDVTAGYGNTTVVHDVDLAVPEGEIACLVGSNGSGKSTVMKSICGFADVFEGRISFDGEDVTHRSPQESLRSGVSYVLQSSSVFPDMTVHENLLMGGYVFADDNRAARWTEELYGEFARFDERRDQKAGMLSGGERDRTLGRRGGRSVVPRRVTRLATTVLVRARTARNSGAAES